MGTRSALERALGELADFQDPRVELEQYATPADLAAHVVHLADLRGDLDRVVLDLGSGTGVLAIAAALRDAPCVVGVERDAGALRTARENARRAGVTDGVTWLRGDATRPPVCATDTTVVMNPPFGAQSTHADRAFLDAAAELAAVSYSIHNAGSRGFVEAFARDEGGEVTAAFASSIGVDRRFAFHTRDRATIDVEVYRIEWP